MRYCRVWLKLASVLLVMLAVMVTTHGQEKAIDVEGHTITNIGPWQADARLEDRPDDLWRYYMHGIVDHFAEPVAWEQIAGEDQDLEAWLVDEPIDTPHKRSDMPAIRVKGEDALELARPLPIPMNQVQGERVRLFIWIRGEDAGARNNCWHAPSMYVTMRDADGDQVFSSDSHFKTLRTFPWHCYYVDRFVPENAEGIYVRLFNKEHGTAYFSTLSWELIGEENTYELNDRQDPVTGSIAPNPLYDEMPYHLRHGPGRRYKWRWVLGEDADVGMVGQPYNITTKQGFERYYFEKAKKDPQHMNFAILHMGSMYRIGIKEDLFPQIEDGWLEHFAQVLIDDQDPETGYWHDGFDDSLGLTFHLCHGHFRYWMIPRADRQDQQAPNLGVEEVPRAEEIIQTTLDLQSTYVDDDGTRRLAAWNRQVYRGLPDPDEYVENCQLVTTWDAIHLLRLSSRWVDEDTQAEVYDSVKAAVRYVFEACVLPDGTWKQSDRDEAPSKGSYMKGIMQDSAWLERKITKDVPAPEIIATPSDDSNAFGWRAPVGTQNDMKRRTDLLTDAYAFEWRDPIGRQNSARIFVVPRETRRHEIDESHLMGIIQRTGHVVEEMDPLVGVQFIREAGQRRFGWSEELPPPDSWQARDYLPWKLHLLNPDVTHSTDLQPIRLKIPEGSKVYAAAATWYGEQSPPRLVELP